MKKTIINTILLVETFVPGSASSNRMICYAKGYRDIGLNVKLLLQAEDGTPMPVLHNVEVIHVKDGIGSNRILRIISRLRSIIKAIKKEYIKGHSVIQVYNVPLFIMLISKKKYNIFCEVGEVPYYAELESIAYKTKEFLRVSGTKRVRGLIVLTDSLKKYFTDKGIINIVVSNIMVDKERFRQNNQVADSKTPHIVYCGTVSKHKDGVDDLIKAFKIVNDKYPSYCLEVIGGFTSAYQDEEYLRQLVKNLNIEEKVFFTGRITPEEMPAHLMSADILALARPNNIQARYGFPTKVGEYLCAGKPIVITRVGELDRLLSDKENCIFSEPNNYKDFANSLLWVIEHPNEAKTIGARGAILADKVFSPISQSEKVLRFMQKVLSD